jgi:hypothetical protein
VVDKPYKDEVNYKFEVWVTFPESDKDKFKYFNDWLGKFFEPSSVSYSAHNK